MCHGEELKSVSGDGDCAILFVTVSWRTVEICGRQRDWAILFLTEEERTKKGDERIDACKSPLSGFGMK